MKNENIPKTKIFEIIYNLSLKIDIKLLCKISGVSISGYYKHKKLILSVKTIENREKKDLDLIKVLVLKYHRKHGYRIITMLIQSEYHIEMNHKKVLRLMNKYDLLSVIRKKDPYSKIRKATQEHRTFKNILNRKFRGLKPFKKLGTDITYIALNGKWCYLSIVKDIVSGEILSAQISNNIGLGFVQNSLKDLEKFNIGGAIIHSDQGFHYTHPNYSKKVKELGLIQSMSRKGNCIDNSPTESFFGHLKDEIDTSKCNNFKELEKYIENYIFYYNYKRPQWNKKKMTPVNYRNHLLDI